MEDRIGEIVRAALQEILDEEGTPMPEALGTDTVLFGREGVLDSLGLVRLLTEVEQRLDEQVGVQVSMMDDRAMSRRSSPFRTLGGIVTHAAALAAGTGED